MSKASDEAFTNILEYPSEDPLEPSALEGIYAQSPLWMVTTHPLLNEFVRYLDTVKTQILTDPSGQHEIVFSRTHIGAIKSSFAEMIRQGEERLHRLCELLCTTYLTSVRLNSVVIGEVPTTHERFTLTQGITREDLYSTIDLDLGNRQLKKLRYFDGKEWVAPLLVANVVEYQPEEVGQIGIHKFVSRIKAEEELWNKVVDEIFNLDSLVRKDKKFWHLSRYVKDVFGLKIVTALSPDVNKVHEALLLLRWDPATLEKLSIPHQQGTERFEFVEVKNYVGHGERKKSGWEALKSVVRWWDTVFEIQVQSLGKFMREREYLTRESHSGFKSRREEVRNQVAEQLPLFRFFRDLLKWLFINSNEPAPLFSGVTVKVRDS